MQGSPRICGRRVLAFAGIAFPEKFFAGLERAGVVVAGRAAFADHHAFTTMDLTRLARKAREMNAVLITTPKDAVRLPAGTNVYVADVHLVWENTAALESLLDGLIVAGSGRRLPGRPATLCQPAGLHSNAVPHNGCSPDAHACAAVDRASRSGNFRRACPDGPPGQASKIRQVVVPWASKRPL